MDAQEPPGELVEVVLACLEAEAADRRRCCHWLNRVWMRWMIRLDRLASAHVRGSADSHRCQPLPADRKDRQGRHGHGVARPARVVGNHRRDQLLDPTFATQDDLKSRFIHEARAAAALPRHRWSMTTTRKARRLRDREGPGPSTTGPRPIHSQTRRVPVHCGPRTSHRCLSRGHLSLIHARLNSGDTHAASIESALSVIPTPPEIVHSPPPVVCARLRRPLTRLRLEPR